MAESEQETVSSVLREHIAFLREMLDQKKHFYEIILAEVKEELKQEKEDFCTVRKDREKVRIALAEAIREVEVHNTGADYETPSEVILEWMDLFS